MWASKKHNTKMLCPAFSAASTVILLHFCEQIKSFFAYKKNYCSNLAVFLQKNRRF